MFKNILKIGLVAMVVLAAIWVLTQKGKEQPTNRKIFIIGTDTVVVDNGIVVTE